MTDQPTGIVTFLFTDIEGSTSMWDSYPMQMRDALTRHDDILRDTIQAHNGYVFKTVGDAFNATFRYPREALRAALAAQRALRDEAWGEPIEEVRVRMALHTGFAEIEHDGDYFGPTLNQAARLLSTAHGGQVLLSGATHNLVHDHPELVDEGARLIDSGEYRLKDLIHPMRVYQLAVPDLRRDFPPLRANRTPDDFDERYRFQYFLGEGGFAKVYLAHDERLKRDVAVKVLHPRYVDQEQFVRRFEREARSVAKLNHPNIITIHDWGQKRDGTHYIVMEYLPGGTLKGLVIKEGLLPPSTAVALTLQIAQALEDAHRRGIVHRDVKPQNVLLSERGDVKVADFGIARAVSASTVSLSSSLLLGTPHYMSPEQVKGEPASFRSDLYSLGVVLYEMITGKLPFDAETPIGILHKHLNEQVRSPKEVNPDVPERVEAVTMRLLVRDPEERYPDAAALMDELKRVRDDLEGASRFGARGGEEGAGPRRGEGGPKKDPINAPTVGPTVAGGPGSTLVRVPDLAGQTPPQIRSTLTGVNLSLGGQDQATSETVPEGEVIQQDPPAGTEVEADSPVSVTVSTGPSTVEIPNLTGQGLSRARSVLTSASLKLIITETPSEAVTKGTIIEQNPTAGTKVERGSSVRVTVSSGPEEKVTTVPHVGTERQDRRRRKGVLSAAVAPFTGVARIVLRWKQEEVLGAVAAMVAGVAWIASDILIVIGLPSYSGLLLAIFVIALIDILGGLVGLHARKATSYGRLGMVGFLASFFGITLLLIANVLQILFNAYPGSNPFPSYYGLGLFGTCVGLVLLGVATLRSRALPRWCGLLLILGGAFCFNTLYTYGDLHEVDFITFDFINLTDFDARPYFDKVLAAFGVMVLGLVWLALGYVLWSRRGITPDHLTRPHLWIWLYRTLEFLDLGVRPEQVRPSRRWAMIIAISFPVLGSIFVGWSFWSTPDPDLRGKTFSEAVEIAAGAYSDIELDSHVEARRQPKGTVIDQEWLGYRGIHISLTVSSGQEEVEVPDVSGLSVMEANEALIEAGLMPASKSRFYSVRIKGGEPEVDGSGDRVTATDPPSGEVVDPRTEVGIRRKR